MMRIAAIALLTLLLTATPAFAVETLIGFAIQGILGLGLATGPVAAALGAALVYGGLGAAYLGAQALFRPRGQQIDPNRLKQTQQGSEGPGIHAFGLVELAGKIDYGNTDGYLIYRLILHCFGPAVAIEQYFYDGRPVTVEANGDVSTPPFARPGGSWLNLQHRVGDGTEVAWPGLLSSFPDVWTADHRVRGIFQTLMRFENPGTGNELFPELLQGGIRDTRVRARVGLFLDPRTETAVWSRNGVLICLHYFRQLPGITDAIIDFDDLATRATEAEALVATLSGTAPRCRLSGGWEGVISTEVVEDMLASAGLEVRRAASGKFTFAWLEDDPDSELTLTERHRITAEYRAGPEGASRPNVCTLVYFSPERGYELAEIDLTAAPWARVQDEIDRYGEKEFPVRLPFCCDASQAQRIARRLFWMARADFGVFHSTFAGLAAWGKRTVMLEIPDVGEDENVPVLVKARIEPVAVSDADGRTEIPFNAIPPILQTPWNPAADEVPPPPDRVLPQYAAPLPQPAEPAWATVVATDAIGGRETRVRFTPVSGAATAEATWRPYVVTTPGAWAGMTEIDLTTAVVAEDLTGDRADFRVRFFDADGGGSLFSDLLEVSSLAVNNTATAAPVLTGTYDDLTATAPTDLQVASMRVEYRIDAGAWTEIETGYVRPSGTIETAAPTPDPGSTVQVRALALTTDGTASPASNIIEHTS